MKKPKHEIKHMEVCLPYSIYKKVVKCQIYKDCLKNTVDYYNETPDKWERCASRRMSMIFGDGYDTDYKVSVWIDYTNRTCIAKFAYIYFKDIVGKAVCDPRDKFDEKTGIRLAVERLVVKFVKEAKKYVLSECKAAADILKEIDAISFKIADPDKK